MYASVIRTQVAPANLDEFIQIYRDQVAPVAQTLAGFQNMRVFVERDTGIVTVVVTYDTEANVRLAAESEQAGRFALALDRLSGPLSREVCEVVVEA
jgi:quinol monooxygenase YgiN